MIGLDCNILIQLALSDHPAHESTFRLVQTEAERGSRLVFPSLVVDEFLHVTTDDRRFNPPLTMLEALDFVGDFLKNPSVALLESSEDCQLQMLRWMREFNLGRKRILDTRLAAVLHNRGRSSFDYIESKRFCRVWSV